MPIFVQVCRTIDKIFSVLFKHRFWKNKWEQWYQQEGSLKHLKKRGFEDKRSWRSCRHQKHSPHKLVTRSWRHQKFWRPSEAERLKNFKCCSNNDLITHIIAEDWKNKAMANSNGFEDIRCLFFGERWKRTIVRSVQPLSPLLWYVSAIGQEQQLCLHQCVLQTWNGFEIDPHRTVTKSGIRSLVIWSSFKRLFLMCSQFNNVSFTPLYKGVKT